jgi:hypothetical protein
MVINWCRIGSEIYNENDLMSSLRAFSFLGRGLLGVNSQKVSIWRWHLPRLLPVTNLLEARSTGCSTEKSRLEANAARANTDQIARSEPRKCAERNAHEKGRDAWPLTFVSSWSTTLAAGFDDVLPQERRSHPRPLPQLMPQAPTMFAESTPQAPTTAAARNAATVNYLPTTARWTLTDRPKSHPEKTGF